MDTIGKIDTKIIGSTIIFNIKCLYIVLEGGNTLTFISMVKSQIACYINWNLFIVTEAEVMG